MLWEKISKNREFASLIFVVVFSITSLVWNGNLVVSGIASFQRVGDFISGSLDSFGSLIKSVYTKLESFEKVRDERDSCLNVMEDYYKLDQELARLRLENESLRRELGFPIHSEYRTVASEVLSVRLNAIYRIIIINKGSASGIKPYMPVVTRTLDEKGNFIEALVGKVIAVGSSTSVVQPIINSNFAMGVSMPGTSLWASLSGNSGRGTEAVLEFIDSGIVIDPKSFGNFAMGPSPAHGPHSTIFTEGFSKIGRAVYTSGGSGVFPKGLPVGIITEEGPREGSFKTAYMKPFVQFDKLENVTVILKSPDKWLEEWPSEKSIKIENPYLGELNYPEEDLKKGKEKKSTTQNPQKPLTEKPVIEKPDANKPKINTSPSQPADNSENEVEP